MKPRHIFLAIAGVLILVLAILAGSKGFFTNPAYFIERLNYKVQQKYFAITKQEPAIQEEIITTADHLKVLLDHPKGYSVSFPEEMAFDLSISPELIKVYNQNTTAVITREWSPYEDVFYFIDEYLNNYYLNETFIAQNRITILKNESFQMKNGARAQLISLSRTPLEGSTVTKNHYTYFFVESLTGNQAFFRIMFKTDDPDSCAKIVEEAIASFQEIPLKGGNVFHEAYVPVIPKSWNKETKQLYQSIQKRKDISWGIFIDGAHTQKGGFQTLLTLDEALDNSLDFSLHYVNLDDGFPVAALARMHEIGKLTELTLQTSYHFNSELFGKNINLDLYDGTYDEKIREFARGAKKFGHPFLFRLNNEMNSDWVNYSGVAALSDPDIFVDNWRRIYRIFEEEGVTNAIWIFNPNAEDCPPCHWNSYIAYYPGNEYVHMIGMTGYNTGTFYAEKYHEKWRTFDDIYQEPYEKYMHVFSEFPFIITEFASSSVGGNKAEWITQMFSSIQNYPNIKMALWWSHADYDMTDPDNKILARPYWLNETDETLEAFQKGLKELKKDGN